MAHLTVDRHVLMSPVTADPCRQEVRFTLAVLLTVALRGDEARQHVDQMNAALGELAVKDADKEVATA